MESASELASTVYSYEYNEIRKALHDVFYMYFYALNGIRTMIINFQTEFLMMLRDRQLSPSLINETELIRFLSTALNKYRNSVIMSYHDNNWKNYYNLCIIKDIKMTKRSQYDNVLFTITIPIRALQRVVFDIYHIIPLYMSSSSSGGYGYLVEPRYRYLAVSSNQDWFTFMENLSDCRSISRLRYLLCRPKLEFIRNTEDDDCIIGLFTKNPKTKCLGTVLVEKFTPQFINLGNNRWFYSIQEEEKFTVKQICLDHDRHNGSIILPTGIGFFTLEQNCYGQSVDNTFQFRSYMYSSMMNKFEFRSLNSAISSSSSSSFLSTTSPSSSSVYWLTIAVIILIVGIIILISIMFVFFFFIIKRGGKTITQHDPAVTPLPLHPPPPPPPPPQPHLPRQIYPLPGEEEIYEDVYNNNYHRDMRDDYVNMNNIRI